jgi:hypothetical protein
MDGEYKEKEKRKRGYVPVSDSFISETLGNQLKYRINF